MRVNDAKKMIRLYDRLQPALWLVQEYRCR